MLAESHRNQTWQFSFTPQYIASKSLTFGDKGNVDFNDRTGWGLAVGYNVSPYISLDLDFFSSNGSYSGNVNEANGSVTPYSSNMYSSSVDLSMTYNIIDDDFTPFVSAKIGSSFVDSGISTGNYYGGTCYDPWSGYYYSCAYPETHTSVNFQYGAGAGLRYDFENRLFVKGGVEATVINLDSDQFPYFISYFLSVGSTF